MTSDEACRIAILLMNDAIDNGQVTDTAADRWAIQHGLLLVDIEPHMSDAFRAKWEAHVARNSAAIIAAAGYGDLGPHDVGVYAGTVALAAIGTIAAPVVRVAAATTYVAAVGLMWTLGVIAVCVVIIAALS